MFDMVRKNFQRYAFLRAAIYIIAGLAIVINPTAVLHFIGYLITAYFALLGLINILEAHKNKKQTGDWGFGLVSGIVFLIIALIVLVFASAIVSILPIILGLVIISNGLFQLFFGLNTKSKGWSLYSVLLLIGGLILLFNPFKSLMFLFQIFGAILIFMGISEIVSFFRVRKMYS
ncbi:HdeD family acid-resistance protein [Enterococcus durans]|uniref:HdeD family acid-resistance protein n=1 Tax=Enterococcus durans TaxID=53345 RepID=UPI0035DACE54